MFLIKYPAELSRTDIWRTRDQLAAHVITWTFRQAYMRFVTFYFIHFSLGMTWNYYQNIAICCQIFALCWQLSATWCQRSSLCCESWTVVVTAAATNIKIGKVRRDLAAEDFNTTTNLKIAITIGTELQASTRWNHSKIIRTYYYAISHHMLLFFRENITKVSSACDSIFSNMIGLNAKREVKDDNRWYRWMIMVQTILA